MSKYLAYKVMVPFNAFGLEMKAGLIYAAEISAEWPEGTVERRIENGHIKLVSVEVGSEEDNLVVKPDGKEPTPIDEKDAKPLTEEEQLLKMMEEDEAKKVEGGE